MSQPPVHARPITEHRLDKRPRAVAQNIAVCVVAGSLIAMLAGTLDAQPAKRATRRSLVTPPTKAAPDVTATIPAPARPTEKQSLPTAVGDDEALPPPFNLPSAPRARMRACGQQWQSIKMAGNAADQTWREFATKCLASRDEAASIR